MQRKDDDCDEGSRREAGATNADGRGIVCGGLGRIVGWGRKMRVRLARRELEGEDG